jgi:hypothetical protein
MAKKNATSNLRPGPLLPAAPRPRTQVRSITSGKLQPKAPPVLRKLNARSLEGLPYTWGRDGSVSDLIIPAISTGTATIQTRGSKGMRCSTHPDDRRPEGRGRVRRVEIRL